MRIELRTDGGYAYMPGLHRPVSVDTDALPEAQAAEWLRLVSAADFFALPGNAGSPPPGAADVRQFTITVDDQGKTHSVSFAETVDNPSLQELRRQMQAAATRG